MPEFNPSPNALLQLQAILKQRPGDVNALNQLGLNFFASGRFAEALVCFRQAVEVRPTESVLHQNLAMTLQNLGRSEEAAPSYRRAIELNPGAIASYQGLAQLLLNAGRSYEAVPLLRKAFELDPSSARGMLQLAQALVEENNFDEAESWMRKAISLESGNGASYELLGGLLKQVGRFEEAMPAFQEAMKLQPARKGIYLDYVSCRKMTEQDRPILSEMSVAAQSDRLPSEDRIRLHFAMAKSLEDLGEFGPAMGHFDNAHRFALEELRRSRHLFDAKECVARFDRIIEVFSKDRLAQTSPGSESDQPLLVIGMVRSGTTLVEQILSRHPQVMAAGELSFWPQNWQSLNPTDRGFDQESLSRLAEAYLGLLNSIAPGARRVTDKMPGNYIALGAIHAVFPRAKIIACRRRPLDNCLSIYTTPFRSAHNWIHSREDIVCFYRQHQRLMAHWREALPHGVLLEIDYEDVVTDPEASTRKMLEFAGLEWDSACMTPEENTRPVKTPSQWQVRQPVYRTSVDRWRNYEPWLGSFRELLP